MFEDIEHVLDEENEPADTLVFRVRRSHFYAITVPLAFLLGLVVGFLAWGQGPDPSQQLAASQAELVRSQEAQSSAEQQVAAEQSVAEQIESLQRYDILVDETDPVNGPEDAPVTIIEFSDFECPFCQRHFAEVYPRLLSDYPDQIRFVYKDLPLTSIHANAVPAAMAAQCAFEQDAFWPFHDLLFGGELGLSRSSYEEYATRLELDLVQFTLCLDENRYADAVQTDMDYALQLGLRSTPTFFVNGIGVVGAQSYEVFVQIIEYELSRLGIE